MLQFPGGAGSPSHQRTVHQQSYKRQQPYQCSSNRQQWSLSQSYQYNMTVQNGVRLPKQSAAVSQACYNCGGFDHWAQNCPEPRRAVPAGAITNQRPYKRQKTFDPAVTKYPVPSYSSNLISNRQQMPFPQRGSTYPPLNHNFQSYKGPPTPLSASRTPLSPWQQHSWPSNQPIPYQGPQRISQASPSSSVAPDINCISPTSSTGLAPQYGPLAGQGDVLQHSPRQTSPTRHGSLEQWLKRPRQEAIVQNSASLLTRKDLDSRDQQSEPSEQVDENQTAEPWWDELQSLDYVEGFHNSTYAVSHPANPVAEALPPTMTDEDLVVRLPIAASLPVGTPVSRYFRNLNNEHFMRSYFELSDGKGCADDPAGRDFPDECECISKDELIAKRQSMVTLVEDARYRDEPRGDLPQASSQSEEIQESEECLGLIPDGLPTPSLSQESEEERQAREQEEKLAALGVTGFAKPVRTSMQWCRVPTTSPSSDDKKISATCGKRNSAAAFREPRPKPFEGADFIGLKQNESPTESYHCTDSLQTPPASVYYDSRFDHDGALARRSCSDDAQNTMLDPEDYIQLYSAGDRISESTQQDRGTKSIQGPRNTEATGMTDDSYGSPPGSRSDQGPCRKRSIRSSSAEVDEGPKRQKDDSHQKEKRKAPRVAAAYSRRW